jgi:hypothetical protein
MCVVTSTVVMPGLDPGIQSVALGPDCDRYGMDCRVKPGNDDGRGRGHQGLWSNA